jgi:hypothetical protein
VEQLEPGRAVASGADAAVRTVDQAGGVRASVEQRSERTGQRYAGRGRPR